MIARYKSGKCQAINLGGTIVKNGGGGFFLSNKLITSFFLHEILQVTELNRNFAKSFSWY